MLFEGEPRYLAHTAPPNARNHGWGTARFFAPECCLCCFMLFMGRQDSAPRVIP